MLAIGLVYVDQRFALSNEGILRFFMVNSVDSARTILSTISGAMIGVAGTVFSVTLVALTLASSQLGPKLIKNFMYVRLNQVVLGSYIATYLYCLIVLISTRETNGANFIPSIAILVAILGTIINIILLIVFIHQIAVSIQADKIISDISEIISKQVTILFPEKMGDEKDESTDLPDDKYKSEFIHRISVKSSKDGYLQYIDSESMINVIIEFDALLEINFRPGNYIVKDTEIAALYTNEVVEEERIEKVLLKFIIGKMKSSQQDIEFSIHQMVEIAVRALSPGVNDPYTAITCIDYLTSTMCYLARVKFPSKYRYDKNKKLRVIAKTFDFEGVLDASFNQIRQYSAGNTAVIIRLMEVLLIIHDFATKERYRKSVLKHIEMVLNTGKDSIKAPDDLKDLLERSRRVVEK